MESNSKTHRRSGQPLVIFAVLLLLALAQACGKLPQIHYYTVDEKPKPIAKQSDDVRFPVDVAIRKFDGGLYFKDDRIAYRESPYEVKFWNYRRWIAPPPEFVSELFQAYLQNENLFTTVTLFPSGIRTRYVFEGKIRSFEEWDEAEFWYGRVKLEILLMDYAEKKVVWQKVVEKQEPVKIRQPSSVVESLSRALHACLAEAISDLKTSLPLQLSQAQ